MGSQGKISSPAASHPTFYPQADGALVNSEGLVQLGSGLTESLHGQFILKHICLLKKIIQTILKSGSFFST